MSDLDDDTLDDYLDDDDTRSTDERWYAYKRACAARDVEPMSWGDWLMAGMPLPID